ncbi:BTAD domain-containing putative transcriptional regulator [Glycomyces sp. NPDC046736]|uniref:AfsR/SARP family transcriptional regulator n=1 Tax=Glycomyces sp. NPDC046736 TaxID=3155615 RepID=UPI003403463D
MEFRLLGALEVVGDGGRVPVRGRHHPKLLAILLDEANRVVPVDRITAGLWDGVPPESARQQVQNVVAGLRRQLGPGGSRLETVGHGYRLRVDRSELDLLRCKDKAAEADKLRAAGDRVGAAAALRAALDEWRGSPFAGLEGRMIEAAARRLEEYRLALLEARFADELELGRDPSAELRQLAAEHPLRQRFTELLMLALHRTGRTPEALGLYAELRTRLAEELGIDPGERLRDLHTAILRDKPAPPAPSTSTDAPALLPPGIPTFTGRCGELASLDALLAAEGTRIGAITGTGGVGKTTLAVHWGHGVADRFPDGQLFVNLRGFEVEGAALAPEEAVRVLLGALGVPHQRIPADPQARFALYRSIMSGKRALVILDNAADAAHARPLVPGGTGNVTLVTSRNPLFGLIAVQGAQAFSVPELTVEEARSLLAARIGRERIAAEPEATVRIIDRCARLPLALAIMGAMAVVHPQFSLGTIADELKFEEGRLDAFCGDDAATDLRAVFHTSYRGLDPVAARLFRFLGLHPGPEITAPAAASLLAVPVERARRALFDLLREHLLSEVEPGRFGFHDLLRAYSVELSRSDAPDEREAAADRMFDHYLQNCDTAYAMTEGDRDFFTVEAPLPGVVLEPIGDLSEALHWFGAERRTLPAVIDRAAATGRGSLSWKLAWAFKEHVFRQGDWHEGLATQRTVLEAAQRDGDVAAQLHARRTLSVLLGHLGESEQAREQLELALELWDESQGDLLLARLHLGMTHLLDRLDDTEGAIGHGRLALEVSRRSGNERNESRALSVLAWNLTQIGRLDEALDHAERAMEIQTRFDAKVAMAGTLDTIGVIRHRQGRLDLALECFNRSLAMASELGHRWLEADTLTHLGDARAAHGETAGAREAWRGASERYAELGADETARNVREKLERH